MAGSTNRGLSVSAGYLSNGQCVATLQLAAQHFCAQFPRTVSTGEVPITYSCAVSGTTGRVILASQAGSVEGSASVVDPYYAACDTETFSIRSSPFDLGVTEGALVASAVVATWALAWGLRQLVRALGVADGDRSE